MNGFGVNLNKRSVNPKIILSYGWAEPEIFPDLEHFVNPEKF